LAAPVPAQVAHGAAGAVGGQQAKVGANAVALGVVIGHQPPLHELVVGVADACVDVHLLRY